MLWSAEVYLRNVRFTSYLKTSQCNSPYEQIKAEKSYEHLNRCRKYFDKSPTFISDKDSKRTKNRIEPPHFDKEHAQ